jgi:hypothetical protein
MAEKAGWVLRDVQCPTCEAFHDLFVEQEPIAPYAVDFTCDRSETSVRYRGFLAGEPVNSKPPEAIMAFVEQREWHHTDVSAAE